MEAYVPECENRIKDSTEPNKDRTICMLTEEECYDTVDLTECPCACEKTDDFFCEECDSGLFWMSDMFELRVCAQCGKQDNDFEADGLEDFNYGE